MVQGHMCSPPTRVCSFIHSNKLPIFSSITNYIISKSIELPILFPSGDTFYRICSNLTGFDLSCLVVQWLKKLLQCLTNFNYTLNAIGNKLYNTLKIFVLQLATNWAKHYIKIWCQCQYFKMAIHWDSFLFWFKTL